MPEKIELLLLSFISNFLLNSNSIPSNFFLITFILYLAGLPPLSFFFFY